MSNIDSSDRKKVSYNKRPLIIVGVVDIVLWLILKVVEYLKGIDMQSMECILLIVLFGVLASFCINEFKSILIEDKN